MANPRERFEQQQRDEHSVKYATVVSDFSPGSESIQAPYPPRFHSSEATARAYAADIFKRKKCSVVVLAPQNKGGAILLDLRFDPDGERLDRAEPRDAQSILAEAIAAGA